MVSPALYVVPPPTFEKIRADLKVPARLEAITMKALAKDVDTRYESVEALGEDLYQCMSSMSTGPPVGSASK